jgi:hypothetical protein
VAGAQGAHGSQKKSLDEAMTSLRDTGRTDHDNLLRLSLARKINVVCGFGSIAPWQVGELDEEWTMLFEQMFDFEKQQKDKNAGKAHFDQVLARKRAAHPSYRK